MKRERSSNTSANSVPRHANPQTLSKSITKWLIWATNTSVTFVRKNLPTLATFLLTRKKFMEFMRITVVESVVVEILAQFKAADFLAPNMKMTYQCRNI